MTCLQPVFAIFCVLAAAVIQAAESPGSPLADAVEQRAAERVAVLLDQGADANAAQPDGMMPLHWAARYDDLELSRRLVATGAKVDAETRYGVRALSIACQNGHAGIVALLLDAGAEVEAELAGEETALHTAARTGRVDVVRLLLEREADVDAGDDDQQTPLMWAAAEGHTAVVDLLLKAGAEFREPLDSGFTPLFFAVREGRIETALRLLQAGVDVNEPLAPRVEGRPKLDEGSTALLLAVENGHFELARALLQAGADPNGRPAGYTALHALTWVRMPIRGDGDPPPHGSGKLTSLDCVRDLVQQGADVNARLERGAGGRGRFKTTGSTAFVLGARASDLPYLKLLLELGANPAVNNADDCTPLLAATGVGALSDGDESAGTEAQALETVRWLLDLGVEIDAVDQNGETAMHGAAYQSRPQIVALLAERGANADVWNRKNKLGWTPLMIAEGHRPGNFRPAPKTIAAIERVLGAR